MRSGAGRERPEGLDSRKASAIMDSTKELGLIMLDREGFRPNVGIILLNHRNQVFWGKRIRTHSWQFPQGGINYGETPEQAMYRELHEEVGLHPDHVRIVARTRDWLRYEFIHAPERLPGRAKGSKYQSPTCRPVARSFTSHTRTSGWFTGTLVTGLKEKLKSSPATQNMPSRSFSSCR